MTIIKFSAKIFQSLLLSSRSQTIFLDFTDSEYYKYNEETTSQKILLNQGIIGHVAKRKHDLFVENPSENKFYDNTVDLITSSSLITMPIIDMSTKEVLAIIQSEYNHLNLNLNVNVVQGKDIKYLDQEILFLFSNCLAKALTILRGKFGTGIQKKGKECGD